MEVGAVEKPLLNDGEPSELGQALAEGDAEVEDREMQETDAPAPMPRYACDEGRCRRKSDCEEPIRLRPDRRRLRPFSRGEAGMGTGSGSGVDLEESFWESTSSGRSSKDVLLLAMFAMFAAKYGLSHVGHASMQEAWPLAGRLGGDARDSESGEQVSLCGRGPRR